MQFKKILRIPALFKIEKDIGVSIRYCRLSKEKGSTIFKTVSGTDKATIMDLRNMKKEGLTILEIEKTDAPPRANINSQFMEGQTTRFNPVSSDGKPLKCSSAILFSESKFLAVSV